MGNKTLTQNSWRRCRHLGRRRRSPGSLPGRFAFSSEEYVPYTGCYHYLYRLYSPTSKRFLTRDPIEEQGGVNLYNFVANNPVNYYDFYGAIKTSPHAALESAIARGDVAEVKMILEVSRDVLSVSARAAANNFLKKVSVCLSIYGTYKALNCKGCYGLTSSAIKKINASCLVSEISGRYAYLQQKCDYVLAVSISISSKIKEANHIKEVLSKTRALVKCLC